MYFSIKPSAVKEKKQKNQDQVKQKKMLIVLDLHFIQPVSSIQCSLKPHIAPVLKFYGNGVLCRNGALFRWAISALSLDSGTWSAAQLFSASCRKAYILLSVLCTVPMASLWLEHSISPVHQLLQPGCKASVCSCSWDSVEIASSLSFPS